MDRVILHCDLNNFYASVECFVNPELRDKPVIVCGDIELRHGIVLAKNQIAKECGIKTGDVVWEARKKCANLVAVTANFDRYLQYSFLVRQIYARYTDKIEAFGIDECWLDVTNTLHLFGNDAKALADTIRRNIKEELGITASIGVSFNKIFAKLGSDMKKPDATTVILKNNYKKIVWKLPVEDLLYVGKATSKKLTKLGINTIGDLANFPLNILERILGKWGQYLHDFANGNEHSPVKINGIVDMVKSVGNSTTTVHDMKKIQEVQMIINILSESVASRLRNYGLQGKVISIYIRNNELMTISKQKCINHYTDLSNEISQVALQLFNEMYDFSIPVRSLGVKVSSLIQKSNVQLDFFGINESREKRKELEKTLDSIRDRFGFYSITRAINLLDQNLTELNPKSENTIHPILILGDYMKNYVGVGVSFDELGKIKPLYINWHDGRKFDIDKIIDIKNCASMKNGVMGTRYTIKICGKTKYLFYEFGKWFVE